MAARAAGARRRAEGSEGVACERWRRCRSTVRIASEGPELATQSGQLPWHLRVAAAHTLSREHRAEIAYRLAPDRVGKLSLTVLLLQGGDSLPILGSAIARLKKALPNARTMVMLGQQHLAMETGADLVVEAVLGFDREIR
jgi:pimeloyl-ACP methyl ester carboxylesterase